MPHFSHAWSWYSSFSLAVVAEDWGALWLLARLLPHHPHPGGMSQGRYEEVLVFLFHSSGLGWKSTFLLKWMISGNRNFSTDPFPKGHIWNNDAICPSPGKCTIPLKAGDVFQAVNVIVWLYLWEECPSGNSGSCVNWMDGPFILTHRVSFCKFPMVQF